VKGHAESKLGGNYQWSQSFAIFICLTKNFFPVTNYFSIPELIFFNHILKFKPAEHSSLLNILKFKHSSTNKAILFFFLLPSLFLCFCLKSNIRNALVESIDREDIAELIFVFPPLETLVKRTEDKVHAAKEL
jgi:hypothetical protein